MNSKIQKQKNNLNICNMKPVIFGLLLIFILNSCRKEILIDLPDHESLLVVNCFFSPEDTFKVKVSASSWLYDGGNKEQDSALVLLFADDLIGDTLIYMKRILCCSLSSVTGLFIYFGWKAAVFRLHVPKI
jgi:hypothetical protein